MRSTQSQIRQSIRSIERARVARRIVTGVVVSAVAMVGAAIGCVRPVATSAVELDITNECRAGDSSHTVAPAATCTYNISSNSADTPATSAISAGNPFQSCGKWMVNCYVSNVTCGGSAATTALSCKAPEYLATNQAVNCGGAWSQSIRGLIDDIVVVSNSDSLSDKPSAAKCLDRCQEAYDSRLSTDKSALANEVCNKVAAKWTDNSKKSAICCIPAPPKLDAGLPTADARAQSAVICQPSGDKAASCDTPAEIALLDAATVDAPGDGSDSCASDPGAGDDPPPFGN